MKDSLGKSYLLLSFCASLSFSLLIFFVEQGDQAEIQLNLTHRD
jgi:hypothetical protein